MKRNIKVIVSASAASLLTIAVLAQDAPNAMADQSDQSDRPAKRMLQDQRMDRINAAIRSSDVIGMVVQNNQNEKLGKVEDLGVDMESGRIVQVILSTGGFLGVGSTLSAIPPRSLQYDAANKVLHFDVSKDKLVAAPKYDNSRWDEFTQSNRLAEVYGYYGQDPYFMTARDENSTTNKDVTIRTEGTLPRQLSAQGKQIRSERANLGYVQKASKLVGTPVKNPQGEKLAKVENIVLDLSAGRIVAVIISSGGFIGLGDELSAVPPAAFQYNANHDSLELNTSKELLASSPHFKANEWPDLSQPGYASGVYRAYKVEPYFGNETSTDVDSARRNVRDRDTKSQMPLNEGNNASDINTNAQMRNETSTDMDNTRSNSDRDNKTLTTLDQGNSTFDINTNGQMRNETSTDADNTRRNVRDRDSKTQTPLNEGNNASDINTNAQMRNETSTDMDNTRRNSDRDNRALTTLDQGNSSFDTNTNRQMRNETSTDADNTRRNVRDRGTKTLTPLDQGNSSADINTTAKIRKEIIADKRMSVNAKNVKIITNRGKVTLRGPVKTAEEKRMVGEIADRIARAENVDNQLDVKLTTNSTE